jgi:hypothetical protein
MAGTDKTMVAVVKYRGGDDDEEEQKESELIG